MAGTAHDMLLRPGCLALMWNSDKFPVRVIWQLQEESVRLTSYMKCLFTLMNYNVILTDSSRRQLSRTLTFNSSKLVAPNFIPIERRVRVRIWLGRMV